MCMTGPFLNWEKTKAKYPHLFEQDGRGEYITSWKLIWKNGDRFRSPTFTYTWNLNDINKSNRQMNFLTAEEESANEVRQGFHSVISVDGETDIKEYLKKAWPGNVIFSCKTRQEDFIACGRDSVNANMVTIVSDSLFLEEEKTPTLLELVQTGRCFRMKMYGARAFKFDKDCLLYFDKGDMTWREAASIVNIKEATFCEEPIALKLIEPYEAILSLKNGKRVRAGGRWLIRNGGVIVYEDNHKPVEGLSQFLLQVQWYQEVTSCA